MWDLKSIVLFMCSILVVIIISMKMANATETGKIANVTETGKSKAEWHELYVKAGCMEKTFLQREICKTKVFQKTNWQSGKDQVTGFFNKLDLSND